MEGFFSKETVASTQILDRLTGCAACGLYRQCSSPKMEASGEGRRSILIIAEAPGEMEDATGKHLIGSPGQFLKSKLWKNYGINVDRDCRKINACNCRPPGSRAPSNDEISHCRPRVLSEIERFQPKMILLLGGAALESFLGNRWKGDEGLGGIVRWRGWTIPDRDVNAWVCPLFHPSYVQRSIKMDQKVADVIFEQDLERAFEKLREPVPTYAREQSLVRRERNPRKIYEFLQNTIDWGQPISIDYETTGLKPQALGHQIVTCSISTSGMDAFAFPLPNEGAVKKKLCDLLGSSLIPKRAHNIKFEDTWTKEILHTEVKNWEWDSMIAAHILDNRALITGLKFQTYVQFGLIDYDSHVKSFLKASKNEVGNGFNRIHEIPMDDLLLYNGLDTIFEFRLSELQRRMIK